MRVLIVTVVQLCFFFFSSRRRHTRSDRDWSSDVCSSDLTIPTMTAIPTKPISIFFLLRTHSFYFTAGLATSTGSTYSFNPSTLVTCTDLPSGTVCEETARHNSPWTRTIPSAPAFNSSVTVPVNPINSSLPVAVFHFRERNTSRIRTTVITPNGRVAASATPRLTPP